MFGGGDSVDGPRPGLLSLAHRGILLADEFFEWPRAAAEALRTPLQDKQVVVARRDWQVTWPADFMLIATANPCPCGFFGHPSVPCRCTPATRRRYLAKLSGPIFDRIDLKVAVQPVGAALLANDEDGELSSTVGNRVLAAVELQQERYQDAGLVRNAELRPGMHRDFCQETPYAINVLGALLRTGAYSSRALNKLRSVARTVADLEGAERVESGHLERAGGLMAWKPAGGEAA